MALGGGGGTNVRSTVEEIVATSLHDRKLLAVKMVGVGFINIPPVIVRHKLVLSIILHLMFSVNSATLGMILYGTHKALNDYCYNPVDPDAASRSSAGEPYTCMPVSPQGFVSTQAGVIVVYMFQAGSIMHTMALAVGVFGCMYLNIFCVLIFMVCYLISYTLTLGSLAMEFFFGKIIIHFSLRLLMHVHAICYSSNWSAGLLRLLANGARTDFGIRFV
jgi:hypothetical protein